jgi:hypothetical protein
MRLRRPRIATSTTTKTLPSLISQNLPATISVISWTPPALALSAWWPRRLAQADILGAANTCCLPATGHMHPTC